MWKVTNEKNYSKLKIFEEKIIKPLFNEIINYKKNGYNCSFSNYLSNKKIVKKTKDVKILVYICKRTINKESLEFYINSILNKSTLKEIRHYYAVYIFQNRQANQLSTQIYLENIPKEFEIIFSKYFYEKFFNFDTIWKMLGESVFLRKNFHENFKLENDINVCPYCDIDTTLNTGNNQIEHFWPKSQYPFLAMNAFNLISSCISCNMPAEGKGTKYYKLITMPYIEQIGDTVNFDVDVKKKSVVLTTSKLETENYLELLNLHNRYANESVYRSLLKRGEAVYSTLLDIEHYSKVEIQECELLKYITKAKCNDQKDLPLYFATLGVFSNYNTYRDYKRKG